MSNIAPSRANPMVVFPLADGAHHKKPHSPTHPKAKDKYRQVSNIKRTLVGNKIVDHSDVVGASPVGAAPTTSSLSTQYLASRDSAKADARQYENLLSVWIWCVLY